MNLSKQRFGALFVLIFCSLLCVSESYAQDLSNVIKPISGKPTDVLAEMEGYKLTRKDFDAETETYKEAAGAQATAQLATPEGRKDFLRQLVEVTMLEKKAEKDGVDKTDSFKKEAREATIISLALSHFRKIINDVNIDEASVKKYYEDNIKRYTEPDEYHLFQISTTTLAKAEEAAKKINGGASFVEVAKEYAMGDASTNNPDRGVYVLQDLSPEIADALVKLEKDKLSAPIKLADDIFCIVKYTDKKVGQVMAFDTVSSQIRKDFASEKQSEAFKKEIERLTKAYRFTIDQKVAVKLRQNSLTDAEKKEIIAKYEGGDVKLGDVYKDLEQIPSFIRPQLLEGEGLNDFLNQHTARVLSNVDAEKNLDKYSKEFPQITSDVSRRIKVKAVFDKIIAGVALNDAEIADFYNKNLASFNSPATFKAHHILVADEAEAKKLLAEIQKTPAKFEEIAKTSSTCPSGKQGGDLGQFGEGQMVKEFEEACKTAEVGKAVGPVKTQFGYHIIRVDAKNPAGTQKLEDVKEKIRIQLLPQKQKQAFDAYVEGLRNELKVKVYQENL